MNLDKIHILLIVLLLIIGYLYYTTPKPITEKFESCPCGANCQCNKIDKTMIKLWVQHLLYTRLVIMAFFTNDKSFNDLMNRLMKNQRDIGDLMGKIYGFQVGQTISNALLKHIMIAGKVLIAIKSNDIGQNTINEFYDNALNIGIYLDKLTHTNKFVNHMKIHIASLINNIVAYTNKNYVMDISTLDIYVNSGLDMAFDMA